MSQSTNIFIVIFIYTISCLGLIYYSLVRYYTVTPIKAHGIPVTGIIKDVTYSILFSNKAIVSFKKADGTEETAEIKYSQRNLQPLTEGDSIDIIYNSTNPKQAIWSEYIGDMWFNPLTLIGAIIWLTVAISFLVLRYDSTPFFIFTYLLLLVLYSILYAKTLRVSRNGIKTMARITSIINFGSNGGFSARVEFETEQGAQVKASVTNATSWLQVKKSLTLQLIEPGDELPIIYNPANPQEAICDSNTNSFTYYFIFTTIIFVGLLLHNQH